MVEHLVAVWGAGPGLRRNHQVEVVAALSPEGRALARAWAARFRVVPSKPAAEERRWQPAAASWHMATAAVADRVAGRVDTDAALPGAPSNRGSRVGCYVPLGGQPRYRVLALGR